MATSVHCYAYQYLNLFPVLFLQSLLVLKENFLVLQPCSCRIVSHLHITNFSVHAPFQLDIRQLLGAALESVQYLNTKLLIMECMQPHISVADPDHFPGFPFCLYMHMYAAKESPTLKGQADNSFHY